MNALWCAEVLYAVLLNSMHIISTMSCLPRAVPEPQPFRGSGVGDQRSLKRGVIGNI